MSYKVFIACLAMIESGNDNNAVGDNGLAVGHLQIHPIMVDDVNRILGGDFYTLECRRNKKRSEDMASVYFNHYSKYIGNSRPETLARIWNGGATGHKKQATLKYWDKFKAQYSTIINKKS